MPQTEHFDAIMIGGGQAGLATGYYLKRQGRDFIILDANARVGDAWRKRWDSLRLFTPARYQRAARYAFPAPAHRSPARTRWPTIWRLMRRGSRYPCAQVSGWTASRSKETASLWTAGDRRFEADNVVVAMGNYQPPHSSLRRRAGS